MSLVQPRNDRFYEELPAFTDFTKVSEEHAFVELPGDWVLLATDIVQSSDAVAEGYYKTVNMIAAATLATILNTAKGADLPFVFGGDGAMAGVPARLAAPASAALAGLRNMAREVAGLELRVGAFPVADLRASGAGLKVRKFQLSEGNHLAMFAGGGLELAEAMLKDPDRAAPYIVPETDEAPPPPLDGLSCRWEPVFSERGFMVTVMLRPARGQAEELRAILADLDTRLGIALTGTDPDAAPVRRTNLRFRFPPGGLWREMRMIGWRRGRGRVLARALFESVVFLLAQLTGRRIGPLVPDRYMEELRRNIDFRKFDDTLRLVLDLSGDQTAALQAYLDAEQEAGRLHYGMHVADSALITCLVFSLEKSRHIHFIDGADGGFTQAARAFKQNRA